MKEIRPKLARELLGRIKKLEAWCDERAKDEIAIDGEPDWQTASIMAFDIRQHLLWHMRDDVYTVLDSELPRDGKYSISIGKDDENTD